MLYSERLEHVISLALSALRQERVFQPFRAGVEVSWLYGKAGGGPAAAFLRYAPGARIPRHRHEGFEHIFVLDGSQQDAHGVYPAGTLIVNQPGTDHEVASPEGCLVLVIWGQHVVFLDDA